MKKWILAAALVAIGGAGTAQAQMQHKKWHHHHAAAAAATPDSVTLDGKEYKVCKAGVVDDCVNPRQAGLGFGNRPTETYEPHDSDQHP